MDKKIIFIFFLVLFSLKIFDSVYANNGILKSITYGFMLISILMSLPYLFKYKGGFVFPIQLISLSIFLSIFMAWYSWGQGLEYSSTTIPYLIWFTFFYFLNEKISIIKLEKIILVFGILYILLFLFQFKNSSVVYFGNREFAIDRGILRIIFPGGGVFFLSCFIAINKFTSKEKHKYLWLLFALVGVVIIILQVTRQQIFLMLLFYMIHFIKNFKLQYKILTVVLFCTTIFAFLNSDNPISRGLAEQQKADASAGEDYIRILGAKYFLTQFNTNPISKVFGNGFYNDNSVYGKRINLLADNYGYFLSDVGVVEVYISFGIFAIIGYIIIFIKSFTIPLPPNYQYLKYYLWLLLCTSLTSDTMISYNFIITTVIVLYIYQRIATEHIVSIVAITGKSLDLDDKNSLAINPSNI